MSSTSAFFSKFLSKQARSTVPFALKGQHEIFAVGSAAPQANVSSAFAIWQHSDHVLELDGTQPLQCFSILLLSCMLQPLQVLQNLECSLFSIISRPCRKENDSQGFQQHSSSTDSPHHNRCPYSFGVQLRACLPTGSCNMFCTQDQDQHCYRLL